MMNKEEGVNIYNDKWGVGLLLRKLLRNADKGVYFLSENQRLRSEQGLALCLKHNEAIFFSEVLFSVAVTAPLNKNSCESSQHHRLKLNQSKYKKNKKTKYVGYLYF